MQPPLALEVSRIGPHSSVGDGRALLLYMALALVPPLAFYTLPVSSQAVGVALALVIGTLLLPWSRVRWEAWHAMLAPACLLLLLAHLVVTAQFRAVDVGRFGGSMLLLAGVLLLAAHAGPFLFDRLRLSSLQRLFGLFMVCATLSLLGLRPPAGNATSKPVFPFSEASHFGLALCPLVLSLCVLSPKTSHRLGYLGGALAVALLLQNFTLLAGLMLVAAVCLPMRWLIPMAMLVAVGIAAALSLDAAALLYYSERLNFGEESENLTALVVIQGWQSIGDAWASTSGWGLGLQQLGVGGPTAEISELIFVLHGGEYLNVFDGGFLLAKLASELGVFGAALASLFTLTALRCAWRLRKIASAAAQKMPPGWVFAHAVVVMYVLEIFVRSAGYLTGSAALLLTALCYLYGHGRVTRAMG